MGITDGTFACGLCGEWLTGCMLCGTAPLVDLRPAIERQRRQASEDNRELASQERAIRMAAERRAQEGGGDGK